jgi:hypothetical protein
MLKQFARLIGFAVAASLLGFMPFKLLSNSELLSPQPSASLEKRSPAQHPDLISQQQNASQQ